MISFEEHYWNKRYENGGNSGAGSYGLQLIRKLHLLANLDEVKSITEVGCGDFNLGKQVTDFYPGVKYHGMDISKVIIERNKKLFPEHTFTLIEKIKPSDLLLCIDVLFHIVDEADYVLLLKDLKQNWKKYLAITAYEEAEPSAMHVKIRKFNPDYFGTPITRVIVDEKEKLYLYIWKK